MQQYTETIREIAKKLLESGEVEAFIGYRKGSVPMTHRPVVIRKAEEVETLVWDSHCALNLANYVRDQKGKIAVLATGCNSRNLVMHVKEHQVERENLHIVGIPCTGMVDHRAIKKAIGDRDILEVREEADGETIVVEGKDFEERFKKSDVLQRNCKTCKHPNPVMYDELVGELLPEPENVGPCEAVEEVEKMEPEERWTHFESMFSDCIRCYACRNACPLCYCPTCFVDENRPQWVGKSIDKSDTLTFHFLRAFHMAGRCTDCGACERVCPVDIPLKYLTNKLNKEALAIYGYEAGMDPDSKPLLDKYKMTDLNDFIR